MFADTTIFENIVRLVKLLDYNVKGCSPSSFTAYLQTGALSESDSSSYIIQPYSMVNTGKTDVNGRQIYFSTRQSYDVTSNSYMPISLYNGQWKLYSTVFTASGIANETFNLTNLFSDTS